MYASSTPSKAAENSRAQTIVLKEVPRKPEREVGGTRQTQVTVSGNVVSKEDGSALPGVNVVLKENPGIGAITDGNGDFLVSVPNGTGTLVFSFIGFLTQEVPIQNKSQINIVLATDTKSLEEVVVVGFGEQRKASMVSSITSVRVGDLKTPSANLTNAIAGQVAGVISFQQSGEPGMGTDNSTFYIRGLSTFGSGKRDPLILIDGIESTQTDMARLQPDDISDFSVLKDAAASSIYGARGANGVVLINTKSGKEGPVRLNFRVENRISTNTKNFKLADNITYMEQANEAAIARSPNAIPIYSPNKINSTRAGEDPFLFPDNNWLDQLIKPYTINQGYNLNLSGGTPKGRYYIAGTYNRDTGVLKVDPINSFNSNVRLNNYSIRSNVELDVTPSTRLIARFYGQFDDYSGPIGTRDAWGRLRSGGETTFDNALRANPVMFPAVYPKDKLPYVEHPLFGSSRTLDGDAVETSTLFMNPYAEMVKGYQTYKSSNLNPQLELKQDLNFLTEGLSARAMTYVKRTSFVALDRYYNPFFYSATINPEDGNYSIGVLNDGSSTSIGTVGTEYLNYNEIDKTISSQFWLQGALDYNRTFNQKHAVGGLLVSYISSFEASNAGTLIRSLPNRNHGVSGRFTYGYDDRYLAEFNFGYNGSERFAQKKRYGFFPSAGIGYRISNEGFFEPLLGAIPNMKLRATYGLVGNDQIGNSDQRFLYMSNVNLNDGGYGASFGRNDGAATYYRPGVSISRYSNDNISWEQSRQINLGMDLNLNLFSGDLELIVDAFKQYRSNILQPVTYIDNASGLMAPLFSNYGKAETQGVDLSMRYNKSVSRDLSVEMRGTLTFATSKAVKVDELIYPSELMHLTRRGHSLGQEWGFIAERLFIDNEEVANAPVQFGDAGLQAGDIKYRDINGDGVINNDDMVPLGYPRQPELLYGFGTNIRYKKFDMNVFFQGSARSTFFINPAAIQPFVQSRGYQNGLLQVVADDHWSEDNRDPYAFWPRLSTWQINSNNVQSTWWMRNGDFLRLKNVDFGYNVGNIERLGLQGARVYFSATNLFVLSKFKMWDVEMGGNGLNYPIQSVYNLGVNFNF
ncbi:TonB-dependent receptor [Pontibacter sp. E15-1]|uniref:SusC/RagA family TonB-linked outer membrane protein n=1 Tax=Pontibacter sp. E15-1 TaxID=2919918 RepID=UPI001F4F59FD|nr:TonB-dependent receptor [Pontibacter sp. E15-1]MCJ8164313.1 TonB-dependent receptor [Pontibacter sp. E15-1]